jgi:FkbM family methyltransferase
MLFEIEKYIKKPIKGIIQVGAHSGGEVSYLLKFSNNIMLFEPQKDAFANLCETVKNLTTESTNIKYENLALGAHNSDQIVMYKEYANSGMSSSLLEPHLHKDQYPTIVFNSREYVAMKTFDDYISDKDIDYNILMMDVQGYELEVLKGAKNYMHKIDYIYCEVNRAELYKNCAMVEEIDNFLNNYNFKRIHTDWAGYTWGDALYEKQL